MPPTNSQTAAQLPRSAWSRTRLVVCITLILVIAALGAAWYFGFARFTITPQNNAVPMTTFTLRPGVYALTGNSGGGSGTYSGTITITPRAAALNVYDLTWNIGVGQQQIGVGILENNVLSVGYMDTTNNAINDVGSVSYVLTDETHLRGIWTSVNASALLGTEELAWLASQ